MNKIGKVIGILLIVLVLAGGLIASSCAPAAAEKAVLWGSKEVGGTQYITSAAMATMINRFTDLKVIVQSLPSMTPIAIAVGEGTIDMTQGTQYLAYVTWKGIEEIKDKGPMPVRAIGAGTVTKFAFFTKPDTGIKKIEDLAGKKVAYITKVSPTIVQKNVLSLEYYGILDSVVSLDRPGSPARTAEGLIEGKYDAYGLVMGTHMLQLKAGPGLVVLAPSKECADYVAKKAPLQFIVWDFCPKGYYGLEEDMWTFGSAYLTYVNPSMSDDVAYTIAKAIYDHPNEMKEIHVAAGETVLERALLFKSPVPYHSGAIRYYKEKGVWTQEMEQYNQKLLAEEKG